MKIAEFVSVNRKGPHARVGLSQASSSSIAQSSRMIYALCSLSATVESLMVKRN